MPSEIEIGDRISIDPKKVGQVRRTGVVTTITQGLSGARYTVAWDHGGTSVFSPGAGNVTIERARGRRRPTTTGGNSSPAKASGAKGKAPSGAKRSGAKASGAKASGAKGKASPGAKRSGAKRSGTKRASSGVKGKASSGAKAKGRAKGKGKAKGK